MSIYMSVRSLAGIFAMSFAVFFAMPLAAPQYAHAEMPQSDVALVQQMGDVPAEKVLKALALYYDLHVSELLVQNMNERRTGAMFAIMRAKEGQKPKNEITKLEQQAKAVAVEREAKIQVNQNLRKELSSLTGIDFAESLVMAPDAPMAMPHAPAGTLAALVVEQKAAWNALKAAQDVWAHDRLALLEAQQRYDDSRDVPIGDFMRAMTLAEAKYARVIAECRLIEAKIAYDRGLSLSAVLSAL